MTEAKAGTQQSGGGSKKKVMLVEDDQFLARALGSKLKKEGFDVTVLRNGDQALEALKGSTPDILLLDLIMPEKDGFAVLEEIRANASLKKLPVMVLSNLGQETDTKATKELGALEHLVKSDTPLVDIVERIKHHLKA